MRHQEILDTQAQKDRAALSQSKGLQNRRLPSNLASKVPEDYSERRRANTYAGNLKRPGKRPSPSPLAMDGHDSIDGPVSPELSEDERKQRVSCTHEFTLEPPNRGHFFGSAILSSVERLSSSRRLKMELLLWERGPEVCPF